MNQNELDQEDGSGLQQKLVDAERKYYANLHILEEKLARIEALQALSKLLIGYTTPSEALDKLVELSVREMGVEKAVVTKPADGGYEICSLRGYSRARTQELLNVQNPLNDHRFNRTREIRKPLIFDNLDDELAKVLELCQMIICPLHSDDGTFHGHFIVGFSDKKIGLFRSFQIPDIAFFEMVGSQVSAILQNLSLRVTFKKFVPRQFLDRLGKEGIGKIKLGEADKEKLTILFADIRDFTRLSERFEPQELLNFLNAYFERMNAAIHQNYGFIDKFIGDAIMALFINDEPGVAAKNSAKAALDMLHALDGFNELHRDMENSAISIGIGIHSGNAIIGTVGSFDRMDSTVLGDSVNLASRIEALTKTYNAELIISSQTYCLIKDDPYFLCRDLDLAEIRGKEKPELIYEIYNNDAKDIVDLKNRINVYYRDALAKFRGENWQEALELFLYCQDIIPGDPVIQNYIDRCTSELDIDINCE